MAPTGDQPGDQGVLARHRLVEYLRRNNAQGAMSGEAIQAIGAVPRELFVPPRFAELAYADEALQLEPGATISAPSMVAVMLTALEPTPGVRVLEIGAGSGYAAAVFAAAGMEVTAVEILAELVRKARDAVARAGWGGRVVIEAGDGMGGWPARAPYDRVVASAAIEAVPQAWLDQLAPGGIVLYPESREGEWDVLVRLRRRGDDWRREDLQVCKFVPMQQ
jgi:protein-L-isoaspartate(D-aspartate) O-methyltransferase